MAARIAVFCCVVSISGTASAAAWRRVGTVTTMTNGQLCTTDGNDIFCDSTTPTISSGNVGIGTTAPQNLLSIGTSTTGLGIYNTADETTNFEKFQEFWSSNVFYQGLFAGGTGSFSRSMVIGLASFSGLPTSLRTALTLKPYNAAGPVFNFSGSTNSSSNGTLVSLGLNATYTNTFSSSSGVQNILAVGQNINQSGTAGYNALLINSTETSTGSGSKYLINAEVGGTGEFTVSDTGVGYFAGNVGIGTTSPAPGMSADINGPVKLAGTGSETCAASTVGAMRYNATDQYMEICTYP